MIYTVSWLKEPCIKCRAKGHDAISYEAVQSWHGVLPLHHPGQLTEGGHLKATWQLLGEFYAQKIILDLFIFVVTYIVRHIDVQCLQGTKEELLEAGVFLAHPLQTVVLGGHHNVLNHQKVLYKLVPETFSLVALLQPYQEQDGSWYTHNDGGENMTKR